MIRDERIRGAVGKIGTRERTANIGVKCLVYCVEDSKLCRALKGVDVLVAEPVGLAMRVLDRQAGRWIN